MPETNSGAGPAQTPVGVWAGVVRHDGQSDPYTISFAPDGTIALRTPVTVGTGTWAAGQAGRFTYELTETLTPASGQAGQIQAHVEAHLDGAAHTGVGSARIHTPDGTLVHTTTAESAGERIGDEPAVWHDVVSLGAPIRGRTLHRGDDGFEEACSGWLLTVEHRPAAVVVAADAGDVAAAVRFAATADLPVAVESTGHGKSVPADGAVFVSTREMRELSVDPRARTARIGAGLRWGEVVDAAAEHGLAPLCGSSEQVGVMGYLTGGGLPMACRTYGFAADHVRSLELVTADGRIRTVSPDQDPDLFWAVRGGTSNFGVVTSAEIDLVPLRSVYGGELRYPAEDPAHAAHVVRSYLAWVKEQPDGMSSSVTLLRLPDVPQLPRELRGRSIVQVHIVHVGDEAQGARLVEPLRALGPEKDTCASMPYSRITELHQDPKHPVRVHFRSALLYEPDDAAVETLVSFIDPAVPEGPFPGIELRHLGGALSRPPARPHSVGIRDAAFHMWMRMPAPAEQADAVRRAADRVLERLRPWDTGGLLPGFLYEHDSGPERVRRAYSEPDHRRLTALKAEYDPHNLFRVNHNIPPVLDGA
ncbi:FAD-binding oxidoreductase [Streptomyces sp. HNM0575]|uniref:FAD-binding oxidoreductase n=1 Tax=Streptomyces sp. HNM0575 TaxID=2716338 RepID=UPI00145D5D74|nr:FAD-binding oxidoreductase [Streptomyces sp. HNM0575]NLU74346.1 FAD-binding oxidoreductase [Streptomyces sp. HNM0575]